MPLKQKCAKTTQATVQGSLRLLGKQAPVTSHTKFSIIIVNSVPQPWSPLQFWLGPFPAPLSFPFSPTCTYLAKKTPEQHRVDFRFPIETFSLQEHSGMARQHPAHASSIFNLNTPGPGSAVKQGGSASTRAGLSFSPWFHHLHHSYLYERTGSFPPLWTGNLMPCLHLKTEKFVSQAQGALSKGYRYFLHPCLSLILHRKHYKLKNKMN